MTPAIFTSTQGRVSIGERDIDYDFYIDASGKIVRRKWSKLHPGKHVLSLKDARELYDPVVNEFIIGSDKKASLYISNEATDFFEEKKCKIKLLPLDEAINYWNRYEGYAIGLFHLAN
ncbi:MAG: hypothetical protein HC819_15375 [Cyclobacteriaceae bacterium]|nr:hypothetical protein [Cyclobacteriaceae bacterium]